MATRRTNPRTKYATDQQNNWIEDYLAIARPGIDKLQAAGLGGYWSDAKVALSWLVTNDATWVARSIADGIAKLDSSIYVDDRVGGAAVSTAFTGRVTRGDMVKAIKALRKAFDQYHDRQDTRKNPRGGTRTAKRNPEWAKGQWGAAQDFLIKEGGKEYAVQMKQHLKRGLARSTMRYRVPEWHQEMVDALKLDDPSTFLALKHKYLDGQSLRPLKKNPVVTRYKTVSEMRAAGVPDIFHRGGPNGRDATTTMLYSSGEQRPFLSHSGHFLSTSGPDATLMHRKRIGGTEGEYTVRGLYDIYGRRKNPKTAWYCIRVAAPRTGIQLGPFATSAAAKKAADSLVPAGRWSNERYAGRVRSTDGSWVVTDGSDARVNTPQSRHNPTDKPWALAKRSGWDDNVVSMHETREAAEAALAKKTRYRPGSGDTPQSVGYMIVKTGKGTPGKGYYDVITIDRQKMLRLRT